MSCFPPDDIKLAACILGVQQGKGASEGSGCCGWVTDFYQGLRSESAYQCRRDGFNPWVGKIPWRGKWQPTLVFLAGKSHGQSILVSYSPSGPKVSYMADLTAKVMSSLENELDLIHLVFLVALS